MREAQPRATDQRRHGVVAPGDYHVRISPAGIVHLDRAPRSRRAPERRRRAVRAAQNFGRRTIAAILTGRVKTALQRRTAVREAGGIVLAEDESTCVVWWHAARGGSSAPAPTALFLSNSMAAAITDAIGIRSPLVTR